MAARADKEEIHKGHKRLCSNKIDQVIRVLEGKKGKGQLGEHPSLELFAQV